MKFPSKWNNFDIYAKPLEDFRIKTNAGAIISISSAVLMAILIFSEFKDYLNVELKTELEINNYIEDTMPININITFPHVPCYLLSLDSLQSGSVNEIGVKQNIYKTRLDQKGNIIALKPATLGDTSHALIKSVKDASTDLSKGCGSCYGGTPPPSGCCNTCEDVKKAYKDKEWTLNNKKKIEQCKDDVSEEDGLKSHEGCNIHGDLTVKKVGGSFHITLGKSFDLMGLHVFALYTGGDSDYSHVIHHLSFGTDIPNVFNPLDNQERLRNTGPRSFQYFLNVVSVKLVDLNGKPTFTNQYTVTQNEEDSTKSDGVMPGVYFKFNISPMRVVYTKYKKTFSQLVTSLMGIVGGIFTVASILDALVYNTQRNLLKKQQLGKFN